MYNNIIGGHLLCFLRFKLNYYQCLLIHVQKKYCMNYFDDSIVSLVTVFVFKFCELIALL